MTFDEFDALHEANANILKAVRNIPALDQHGAAELTDRLFAIVIGRLQRDPNLPPRTFEA
jgi:hypothetical protein